VILSRVIRGDRCCAVAPAPTLLSSDRADSGELGWQAEYQVDEPAGRRSARNCETRHHSSLMARRNARTQKCEVQTGTSRAVPPESTGRDSPVRFRPSAAVVMYGQTNNRSETRP
jgi:hypothetical protein